VPNTIKINSGFGAIVDTDSIVAGETYDESAANKSIKASTTSLTRTYHDQGVSKTTGIVDVVAYERISENTCFEASSVIQIGDILQGTAIMIAIKVLNGTGSANTLNVLIQAQLNPLSLSVGESIVIPWNNELYSLLPAVQSNAYSQGIDELTVEITIVSQEHVVIP